MQISELPIMSDAQFELSGIYVIFNKVNNKCYVGQAKNFKVRRNGHWCLLHNNSHHSQYLQNSWNFYGEDRFEFIAIEFCEIMFLNEREQYWINYLKSVVPNGYNVAPVVGSPTGIKRSAETRKRMSEAFKGRKLSYEQIERLRIFHTGRKRSAEVKAAMSKRRLGVKASDEHRANISKALSGLPKSKEHSAKVGLSKRKPDIWPHDKGNRCLCEECKNKRNKIQRLKYKANKNVG